MICSGSPCAACALSQVAERTCKAWEADMGATPPMPPATIAIYTADSLSSHDHRRDARHRHGERCPVRGRLQATSSVRKTTSQITTALAWCPPASGLLACPLVVRLPLSTQCCSPDLLPSTILCGYRQAPRPPVPNNIRSHHRRGARPIDSGIYSGAKLTLPRVVERARMRSRPGNAFEGRSEQPLRSALQLSRSRYFPLACICILC